MANELRCEECGHLRHNKEQASSCCTMQGTPCPSCSVTLTAGVNVRITTMARTDACGRIIEVRGGRYLVRLQNWQADGYHLDVMCDGWELLPAADPAPPADYDADPRD